MKKRKTGRTLSRTSDQRLALKRTMLTSLILHKRITTTLAKAKELRPFAERMVTRAKKASPSSNQQAVLRLLQKDITHKAANELIKIAESFSSRNGGYTRIIKLAPRKSDGAQMAVIELVGFEKDAKDDSIDTQKEKKKKGEDSAKEDKKGAEDEKPGNEKSQKARR